MQFPLNLILLLLVCTCAILIILWARKDRAFHYSEGEARRSLSRAFRFRSAMMGFVLVFVSTTMFIYLATSIMQQWYVEYPLQQRGITVDAIILKTETGRRNSYYIVYEYGTTAGAQPEQHFQRMEGVRKEIYQQAYDHYYHALETHSQAHIQIRYLPENPAVARLSTSISPSEPVAQVAFTLGLIAFGMLFGPVPMFITLWRWLAPQHYWPWVIGSLLITHACLSGLVFWLSAP